MQYLYKNGVQHRDLKANNCLVVEHTSGEPDFSDWRAICGTCYPLEKQQARERTYELPSSGEE